MNCPHHPEKEVVAYCGLCGDSFCEDCLVVLEDKAYCKKCLAAKMKNAGEVKNAVIPPGEKSRFWAFVFSVIPGVGYLYLGLMNRGLQTMLLFFGSIFVAGFIGFQEIMALIVPVVMFYSIFDTQQLVKTMNEGIPVEDKQFFDLKKIPLNQSWLGYALIVVGILALMQNVMAVYIPYLMFPIKRVLPPLIIIGLGVAILYRNTRK